MKKFLLATTAIAAVGLAGPASAQSVLERVLGQIDNATNLASVNGTFANIAENIGGDDITVYVDEDGESITQGTFDALVEEEFQNLLNSRVVPGADPGEFTLTDANGDPITGFVNVSLADIEAEVRNLAEAELNSQYNPFTVGSGGVDASVTNIMSGLSEATQQALISADVQSLEFDVPEVDIGDITTVALGAVNDGSITLGVNASIDEASTTSTNAISAAIDQIGGSTDTGALVLNIASNMTGIDASVRNVMSEVNGTIGDVSTTALGAVNTGVIVSGVESSIDGIVGRSGANVASNGGDANGDGANGDGANGG